MGDTPRTRTVQGAARSYVERNAPQVPYTVFQGIAHRRLREIRAAQAQVDLGDKAGPFKEPQPSDVEPMKVYDFGTLVPENPKPSPSSRRT